MSKSCEHTNPLSRQGTSQSDRDSAALSPEKVKLHDLGPNEWMEFAEEYAKHVNYYSPGNIQQPSGDWQNFFEQRQESLNISADYTGGDTDPYLGLFIAFLKLLNFPQKSLNELPRKHLNYYYRDVLRLKEKPYRPDKVHALFELAKNARDTLVEEGTLLDAGNDTDGNPLRYKLTSPLVVNHSKVEAIKSVFTDDGFLRFAHNARHPEGKNDNPDEQTTWSAFGDKSWQKADLSFYMASPVLFLKESERTITVRLKFDDTTDFSGIEMKAAVTTEEEWLSFDNVSPEVNDKEIKLDINLKADDDPVTGYDEKVHESGLKTDHPALKITFTDPEDYTLIRDLELEEATISVEVKEVKTLHLRNELGNLDPSKPFMPFGPQPKIDSKLSVAFDEMAGKPVTNIGLNLHWLNLPDDFTDHYSAYEDLIEMPLKMTMKATFVPIEEEPNNFQDRSKASFSKYFRHSLKPGSGPHTPSLYQHTPQADEVLKKEFVDQIKPISEQKIPVKEDPKDPLRKEYKVDVNSNYSDSKDPFKLFPDDSTVTNIKISGAPVATSDPNVDLRLKKSFFHDLYPKVYLKATINADGNIEADDIPNPPYTPLLDELTLDYTAEVTIDTDTSGYAAEDAKITLFRQHPFGTEHVTERNPSLLPDYRENSLFIGLKGLKPGNNLNLLFQVDEGSENPEHSHFEDGEEPKWWVLTSDKWHELEGSAIVRNNTNNFLRSGIVELQIPREATHEHSLMPSGLSWLCIRLKEKKQTDSVPKFINIHAQVAEAVFEDNENGKDHLENSLPAESISQLVYRRSSVKSVEQPYSSFGGAQPESSASFYRRVSERLRHKNRAVSIWDYEHLVLEEFSEIYKVKCLNHTQSSGDNLNQLAPGQITLVLVPKLPESSSPARFYPKASQDLMDRVHNFLKPKMSLHTNLHVVNPDYEKISFEFGVKFKSGLDFNYHKNRAEEDLKKLLTPWMFDHSEEIRFGESFYKYEIIHYLESLGYIEFVEKFSMVHIPAAGGATESSHVSPSHPAAILVSGNHDIEPAKEC